MLRQIIFQDRREVTGEDMENQSTWTQESDDSIVQEGIAPGRRFTGFEVTKVTQSSVTVAKGKLWNMGPRYYRDDPGGYLFHRRHACPRSRHPGRHWRGGGPRLDQHHTHRSGGQPVLQTLHIALDKPLGGAISVIGFAAAIACNRADDAQRSPASTFHGACKRFGEQGR